MGGEGEREGEERVKGRGWGERVTRDGNFKMVLLFFFFLNAFLPSACQSTVKNLFDEDVNMFDANRHDTHTDKPGSMDLFFKHNCPHCDRS